MNIIFNAVLPTVILLVLGNVLRRTDFLSMAFWSSVDKLTYFVLFPALLTSKVSQVDLSLIDFGQVVGFIAGYFSLVSFIAYGVYHLSASKPNQLSSIYQGVLRFNTYIFFAIIEAVWGSHMLSLAALFAGLVIPMVNICCVAVFSFGSHEFKLSNTLLSMAKNPLILAIVIGFTMNHFPVLLPTILFNGLDILSKAALPLALLSVGAAVRVKLLFKNNENFTLMCLWLTSLIRLTLVPLLAFVLALLLGASTELRNIMVLFAATPTATSAFILAKQLGGDSEMMATLISLQTVLSILTLSIWLLVLV